MHDASIPVVALYALHSQPAPHHVQRIGGAHACMQQPILNLPCAYHPAPALLLLWAAHSPAQHRLKPHLIEHVDCLRESRESTVAVGRPW